MFFSYVSICGQHVAFFQLVLWFPGKVHKTQLFFHFLSCSCSRITLWDETAENFMTRNTAPAQGWAKWGSSCNTCCAPNTAFGFGNKMLEGTKHVVFLMFQDWHNTVYSITRAPATLNLGSIRSDVLSPKTCLQRDQALSSRIPGLANLMFEQLALASFTRDYELRKPRNCRDRCNSSMSRT